MQTICRKSSKRERKCSSSWGRPHVLRLGGRGTFHHSWGIQYWQRDLFFQSVELWLSGCHSNLIIRRQYNQRRKLTMMLGGISANPLPRPSTVARPSSALTPSLWMSARTPVPPKWLPLLCCSISTFSIISLLGKLSKPYFNSSNRYITYIYMTCSSDIIILKYLYNAQHHE